MLDAGIGETKANSIVSALNSQALNQNSLKRWERHVGKAAEKLADESCLEAIENEKLLTLKHLEVEK